MTKPNDIFETIGRDSGETLPEGYFESFKERMKASLPEREWQFDTPEAESVSPKRKFWLKIRPYAYMAAMFAGIWCMMNMFDIARSGRTDDISNSPTLLAALDNESFVSDYVMNDIEDIQLYDDLYESGFDPSTLANYDL